LKLEAKAEESLNDMVVQITSEAVSVLVDG
jgi:hypothetical protein